MTYTVTVDAAPAYELLASLHGYLATQAHRLLDLGDKWAAEVQERLTPELAAHLAALDEPPCIRQLGLLVRQCPGDRSAETFLQWLATLSPGELYERLAPHTPPAGLPLSTDLGALRDRFLAALAPWHEQYFRHIDPAILRGLEADANRLRALPVAPEAVVEHATNGLVAEPGPGLREIVLIPQFHKRPLIVGYPIREGHTFLYPMADLPGAPGEPAPALMRITRALSDESRLRILHFLAGRAATFTEVVEQSGLTKGTVHKHIAALRSAGLIRAHFSGGTVQRYSLRQIGRASCRATV